MYNVIRSRFRTRCVESGILIKSGSYVCLYQGRPYSIQSATYKRLMEERSLAEMVTAQEDAYFDNFCQSNGI